MKLLNFKKNIFKKILYLLPLSFLFNFPSHAELKIVEFEDSDSLVETILKEASNTMGKQVGAKKVNWSWCKEDYSYYDYSRNKICLRKSLKNKDLALAFTTAHEYGHHVQKYAFGAFPGNNWRDKVNIVKLELQADCFAGVILASIPNFYITPDDATKMIEIVAKDYGDTDYDYWDHHGSGESRALAFRSGLRFGASKGSDKDNYYKVYCSGDVSK